MTALRRAAKSLVDSLRTALTSDALPGETASFGPAEQQKAAEFIADVALLRAPGEIAIRVESTGGEAGKRRMRLVVVNDDMPFLVDSVAAAIAAATLSTRNGMSSLTTTSRIRLLPASPPVDSTRMAISPGARSRATSAMNSAAFCCSAGPKSAVSPGKASLVSAVRSESTRDFAARRKAVINIVLRQPVEDGGGL